MKTLVKNPTCCSNTEIARFEALVNEGGEVESAGLQKRILRAELLIFIYDNDDQIVAVGAIKNPNEGYKSTIFEKSGASGQEQYDFELGWLYVAEIARGKGYGRILMELICKQLADKSCFATTRENNVAMQYLFNNFGFSHLGKPYKSTRGKHSLTLYVKD
ncbi:MULTISPECIES: GNAT family N-acetyltransferase [Enterobacter cloacae complex]|uniref:GNAT family N-acetyltransferase n=1 Tax=Enterobacter cloacae complex TaxID=354276 RepID=UPI000991E04C|nr:MULTISPECIES: GNAT family N-acetyltransferase [Enterobacter cloacae complex]MDD9220508.1 GNAT family N-acetyltransferase [Enterobacter kobei]OOV77142.1 GNAT family N-acetyltransferase [Enterobacter kobei]UOZ17486.1 GNAT family N-acetyltransferase [Enterobacter asburiae]WCF41434.1 GNAT family N-acetyltransferase [Enterobacter roggenkampii]